MGSFDALNTGLSALLAHRRAVEVISHNIANVQTEGYTRRRVDLQAMGPGVVPAVYAKGSETGNGVHVASVTRVRDQFLEAQYRSDAGRSASLDGVSAMLDRVEAAFPEPGTSGIAHRLGELWSSFDSLVNQPDSEAARMEVLTQGDALVSLVRQTDDRLRSVHADSLSRAGQLVHEVNGYASRLAEMNEGIRVAVVAGESPNDLIDERDLLADKLAGLVGATVVAGEHETANVFVGGTALVHGGRAEALELINIADPALDATGFDRVQIRWTKDSFPATITGGELSGYLEGANDIVPRYVAALDAVTAKLVTDVNTLHQSGKDLDGATGHSFFAPGGTTARTLAISADVAGAPRHLAAAAVGAGQLDTSVAEKLASLRTAANGADTSYRTLIVGMGSEVKAAMGQQETQRQLTVRLDQDRKAVKGVNIDEEMVALVGEQHAYAAAARIITAVDEMLDTLINRTGVVGR